MGRVFLGPFGECCLRTNWHVLYLTHNNRLINLNYPCKSKLSAQVLMYLEHLINEVLATTLTHLFTSSQFSFSKHVFPCGARVEEEGVQGPWAVCRPLRALPIFMVPPTAAWISLCPASFDLWVSSLLPPRGRWPEWPASEDSLGRNQD